MECTVCVEKFNKTSRAKIACLFCSYTVCQSCCRQYILTSFNEPHCMNCRKEWSREFLASHLPHAFMFGDYKRMRETLLFEEQKPLLAATQAMVPFERKRRGLQQMKEKVMDELAYFRYIDDFRGARDQDYLLELITTKINSLTNSRKHTTEAKKFIMKCPSQECRGFLSTRYKCGTCSVNVCPECHEEKTDAHICNSDTIKTVEELRKSTRNCPTCQTPIYKSSGCDQMWCIQCHTAFSWSRGTVEKGIVHNPHYFEFMRSQGNVVRNPNEMVCGGLPDQYRLVNKFNRQSQDRVDVSALYRKAAHYRHAVLDFLPTGRENVDHQDLRLEYLLNDITEKEFKSKLQRREKERHKNREYRQVVETYVNVMEELIRQIDSDQLTPLQVKLQEEELVDMINKRVRTLSEVYNVKLTPISVVFG